jgi:hypothetical protein
MKTLEMMNKAELDGRTYVYRNMYYSKEKGFTEYNGKEWDNDNAFSTPNNLLILDGWKKVAQLSDAERVILTNADDKYKWIARDDDEMTYLYDGKPYKNKTSWSEGDSQYIINLAVFNHLFQFIQWSDSEPRLIAELMEV